MKAPAKNESVKVAIRVRPLNKRETELNSPVCTQTNQNAIDIKKNKEAKEFIFDYVFGIETRQHQVYQSCGYSIVENALQGFNGTVFAYGQTGAGKTFTMVGDYRDPEWKGIIPRGFDHVITAIQTSENRKYVVRASFIEIYNEDIYDLLDKKGDVKKELKESKDRGVFIKDLKTVPVKSVDQMFQLLDYGNNNRSVAKTNMNATSSRSHALFSLHVESLEGEKVKASKLNFVDLAGSERQGKTGATGDTLKEGAKINLSLTALGNVINALVDGKKGGHIPYRDSKLTRLLQDSLGGNTKTLMIASVSPAEDNYDETVSTLRYAARARNIKNTPKINEDPKDALIRQYMAEIEALKKQLGGSAKSIGSEGAIESQTSEELAAELQKARQREKQLSEKQAQILSMKVKMKEMEQLMLHREKESPELEQLAKKRRLQKKKIMKNQEINANKVHDMEEEEEKDVQDNSPAEQGKDIAYWRSLAKRLRKKLKQANKDRQDLSAQFEDERQRLNNCIRVVENDLSFYKQIAEKFMSQSDLAALRDASILDFEKREYTIPPFLMRDEKLTLPKTLRRHEVEDLWVEKRKGFKLQVLSRQQERKEKDISKNSSSLSVNNSGALEGLPESKSTFMGRVGEGQAITPMLKNRRILNNIDYMSDKYKEKSYNANDQRQTFFRRTNFMMRDRSESEKKRPPSAFRVNSRTKLDSIQPREKKEQSQRGNRSVSRGKEKLQPIKR